MDRCQGVTKSGGQCLRRGPWCAQHDPSGEPRSNVAAFADLVESARADGRLTSNVATIQLGRTLSVDMDRGQVIVCACGEVHAAGRSAALVKQYRDVLEAVCDVGADADDPIAKLLTEILDAS